MKNLLKIITLSVHFLLTIYRYALQQYGRSRGYDLPTSFYEELAWGGLIDTDIFKALDKNQQQKVDT